MSIEPDRDQFFQYATFALVGVTVLVCLCYGLIFLNPLANPLIGLRPATATVDTSVAQLPPTWTPTFTSTPTDTPTDTSTPTSTSTSTNTPLPTLTPSPTRTLLPTPTRVPIVPTRRPPTPTRRPIVPTPLPPPPTAAPPPPPAFDYKTVNQGCFHSGQTFVEGTVYTDAAGSGVESGVRVRLSSAPGGSPIVDDTTGSHGGRPGYYVMFINTGGAQPGTWFVWLIAGDGHALSDPQAGVFQTNNFGPDTGGTCWRQVYDFVRQR